MPKYIVTKPIYYTIMVEAENEDEAMDVALGYDHSAWRMDDDQPSLDASDLIVDDAE